MAEFLCPPTIYNTPRLKHQRTGFIHYRSRSINGNKSHNENHLDN